jgi:hypothetical protein
MDPLGIIILSYCLIIGIVTLNTNITLCHSSIYF